MLQPMNHFARHGIFSYREYENQITHFRWNETCFIACMFKQVIRKVILLWTLIPILLNTKGITIPHPFLPDNTILSWRRQMSTNARSPAPSLLPQQIDKCNLRGGGSLLKAKARLLCFTKRKSQGNVLSAQRCAPLPWSSQKMAVGYAKGSFAKQ